VVYFWRATLGQFWRVLKVERKYWNKNALRDRLWLRKDFKPLIASVGRLDSQKGVHLVRHALFYALAHGAQFVALGPAPDPAINQEYSGA